MLIDDRGSAVVEFCLMSVLLVMLLFAVLQVAAVFYVRSVASAAAADGARYAANAGVPAQAGAERAASLLAQALSPGMARRLPCAGGLVAEDGSGLVTAEVRCRGTIRSVFLPIGALVTVDVSGQSLKDDP
ncbi:MAG TPA: TadE/TadG family type IV pilus assembly protein [Jatrophihabitans sp.]|uniref:TadE/TadG family type IV pilus assembly protein n=1 Tax=Jatrophihabitans sp. TaxID=1932789 RepID=UPI002F14ADC2